MSGNLGKKHCRIHRLEFDGDDGPDFSDVYSAPRCRRGVYPGKPGSARLALAEQDLALNATEAGMVDEEGFYTCICAEHASVVFERAVKARVCQSPGCNPPGDLHMFLLLSWIILRSCREVFWTLSVFM